MERLPKSLWGCKHRSDVDHPLFGSNHSSVFACNELLPVYRRLPDDATAEEAALFARLLKEHLAVFADDPKRARFLDKTHTNIVKVGFIDRLLEDPDPFFVLVLRNPYGTCYRAVRRKPPDWRRPIPYEAQLALAAEHWANSNRLALEDGSSVRHFAVVRFEDYVAQPEQTVRALCAFTGLDYRPQMVPRPEHTMPFATLGGDRKWYPLREDPWIGQVPPKDADVIAERCEELATRFGYSPEGTTPPSNDLYSPSTSSISRCTE